MAGFAEMVLGAAPLAGGLLLGATAGNLRGPDVRGSIKTDMDLLDRLPEEQVQRRAELQRSIDTRVDELIMAVDKNRNLLELAQSYRGNRRASCCCCALPFTIVWWNVNHSRSNWLLMFVAMILASVITAVYAGRGIARAIRSSTRGGKHPEAQ